MTPAPGQETAGWTLAAGVSGHLASDATAVIAPGASPDVTDALAVPDGAKPGGAGFCGVAAAASLLGDTWTLLLLRELATGPRRFTELEAGTGISPRVLTDRLRSLTHRGMLTRQMFAEIPPRVEYTLTDMGRAALPVLAALRAYGERWLIPASGETGDETATREGKPAGEEYTLSTGGETHHRARARGHH